MEPGPVLSLSAWTATEFGLELPLRISPSTPTPWSPEPTTARPSNEKPWTPLDIGPPAQNPITPSLSLMVVSAMRPAFSLYCTPVVLAVVRTALRAGPFCAEPLWTTPVWPVDQLPVLPTSTCVPGPAASAGLAAATVAAPSPAAASHSKRRRSVVAAPTASSLSYLCPTSCSLSLFCTPIV